jgi:hypothetical protein
MPLLARSTDLMDGWILSLRFFMHDDDRGKAEGALSCVMESCAARRSSQLLPRAPHEPRPWCQLLRAWWWCGDLSPTRIEPACDLLFVCRAPVTSASQIRVSVQISAPSLDLERSGDGGSRKQQRLVWTEQNHYEAQLARCTHMHGH